jgi:hypothetical protein
VPVAPIHFDQRGLAICHCLFSYRLFSLFILLSSTVLRQIRTVPLCPGARGRPWIRAATDNEGLLKILAQALERGSYPFPSDALRAEYDVIVGLITIIQSLPFNIHWEHVKSHQDDVVPADQLTCMEQLNILADELATNGLAISTEEERLCPLITPSIVELRVNDTTITSPYATHLRQAAGSEAFFKWFIDSYDWDTRMITWWTGKHIAPPSRN